MLDVYTTCPSLEDQTPASFREQLVEFARRTEAAGLTGMLTHSDNPGLDPWATAQLIIESTATLVPLVAVNPIYMHPLSAVRMINTFDYLYGRRVDLNLITGGFARHLTEVGNPLDHDQRYDRLTEYGEVMRLLLGAERAISYSGTYYALESAHLSPQLSPGMLPRFFVAGGSEGCLRTQQAVGAVRLFYPKELSAYQGSSALHDTAIGFGIIARESAAEAWTVAYERFPVDELGEELHQYAAESVESVWHQNLARGAAERPVGEDLYWLYPFKSYQTLSPYLVGSVEEVADALAGYHALGVSSLVLEMPEAATDLDFVTKVFDRMRLGPDVPR